MTQFSRSIARPRWRSTLATLTLVGALFAASSVAPASAEGTGIGVISGTVTDPNGQPLEGVTVSAIIASGAPSEFFAQTGTDASGNYQFIGLAVDTSYSLQTYLPGYPNQAAPDVSLTAVAPAGTVNFVLTPYPSGNGTIHGLASAEGAPLSNLLISAWNSVAGVYLHTYSDADGVYAFTGLANGLWEVSAWAGDQYVPLDFSFQLTETSHDATVNLAFAPWPVGTSKIRGVVTDSATGEPIVGATIYSWGLDVPHSASTTSDETGAFSFDSLPTGTYELSFGDAGYLNVTKDVRVHDGQSVTTNFALIALNATISGRVSGPGGVPLAGVWISAWNDNGGSGAETDANGNYVITNVAAVKYTLSVGGAGTAFDQQLRTITGVANGDVTTNFTLVNRTTGSLAGTVLGPNGGYYTKLVCAALYSSKSKKPLRNIVIDGEHYGEDVFLFDNLKPGAYTVEVRDCDDDPATKFDKVFLGGVKNFKDAEFVTVGVGQDTVGHNITLTSRD